MSEFPIQLLGELIAVRYEVENAGPIKLPDWQRSLSGVVIATGPGEGHPTETKVGDKISFGAAVGMEGVFDGQPIRILRDKEVDFVLESA